MREAHKPHCDASQHRSPATRPKRGYEFRSRPGRSPVLASNRLVRVHFGPLGARSLRHDELHRGSSEDHRGSIPRNSAASCSLSYYISFYIFGKLKDRGFCYVGQRPGSAAGAAFCASPLEPFVGLPFICYIYSSETIRLKNPILAVSDEDHHTALVYHSLKFLVCRLLRPLRQAVDILLCWICRHCPTGQVALDHWMLV